MTDQSRWWDAANNRWMIAVNGEWVDEVATTGQWRPPPGQVEPPPPGGLNQRRAVGCLLVVVVLLVLMGGCFFWISKTDTSNVDALVACKQAVKDRLKSPGTADFDWGSSSIVHVSGDLYTYSGVVNSQNSFGGVVPTRFTCDATAKNGTAVVNSVTVTPMR